MTQTTPLDLSYRLSAITDSAGYPAYECLAADTPLSCWMLREARAGMVGCAPVRVVKVGGVEIAMRGAA